MIDSEARQTQIADILLGMYFTTIMPLHVAKGLWSITTNKYFSHFLGYNNFYYVFLALISTWPPNTIPVKQLYMSRE